MSDAYALFGFGLLSNIQIWNAQYYFLIFSLVASQDDCQFFMKKLEKLTGYNQLALAVVVGIQLEKLKH